MSTAAVRYYSGTQEVKNVLYVRNAEFACSCGGQFHGAGE